MKAPGVKGNDDGFTIAETIVAMFVMGVVGAGVASSMVFTSNIVGENTLAAQGVAYGQKALEDLRTLAYDDIVSGSDTAADGRFTIARTVHDDYPESGMKLIDVTVTWSWKGQSRSYVLHTVYTQITKS